MSEAPRPSGPEHLKPTTSPEAPKQRPESGESHKMSGERQLPGQSELAETAKAMAISTEHVSVSETESGAPQESFGLHQELKASAYQRTLEQTRRGLNVPEKTLSKIIHARSIETASELSAKTIGRPYALFVAACSALIGSIGLLYASKHYGFTYNYTVFLALFIIGYVLGLLLEVILKALRRTR